MQPKSLILLILALGCGVVAAMGITQVLANRSSGPSAPTIETDPVFVALADIEMGELIDAQALKLEEWPKDKVPEGALAKLEDVEGRRPKTHIFAGEPIREQMKQCNAYCGISHSVRRISATLGTAAA